MEVCKQDIPRKSVVGYCQVTDVQRSLLQYISCLRNQLPWEKTLVYKTSWLLLTTYAKAVEVRWQKQEELNRAAVRLGVFHTQFVHLSLLLGNDSNVQGLKIIDSDVVASGSIKDVIEGKQYSRAVRA